MHRLPTLGEVTRWFREPDANPWTHTRVARDGSPATHALVTLGLAHGDRAIQQLGVLERWQLRPELELVLHGSVTAEWSEAEVHELVDMVLQAWGLTAGAN